MPDLVDPPEPPEPPDPELDGPSARQLRHQTLRASIEAYRERWRLTPIRDWDMQLEWADRVHATAAMFDRSRPEPGEVSEPKFRLPKNPPRDPQSRHLRSVT